MTYHSHYFILILLMLTPFAFIISAILCLMIFIDLHELLTIIEEYLRIESLKETIMASFKLIPIFATNILIITICSSLVFCINYSLIIGYYLYSRG